MSVDQQSDGHWSIQLLIEYIIETPASIDLPPLGSQDAPQGQETTQVELFSTPIQAIWVNLSSLLAASAIMCTHFMGSTTLSCTMYDRAWENPGRGSRAIEEPKGKAAVKAAAEAQRQASLEDAKKRDPGQQIPTIISIHQLESTSTRKSAPSHLPERYQPDEWWQFIEDILDTQYRMRQATIRVRPPGRSRGVPAPRKTPSSGA